MKKILFAIAILSMLFLLGMFASYKVVNKGKTMSNDENKQNTSISTSSSSNNVKKDENKASDEVKEKEFKEINKNSQVANDIFDFIPKSFQTYTGKMNEDYMLYEAISRLSKQGDVATTQIEGIASYGYDDVNKMLKTIYGDSKEAVKKETYTVPVKYFEKENSYCLYPVGIDKTDNMMVVKSVEESDKRYKITVYSVCVYMDLEDSNSSKLYIVTKDTIKKYYQLVSRNDKSIKDTYKEYTLVGTQLDANDIVEKYEKELPLIEYYLTKTSDKENKYYISDIKDVY